MTKIANYLRHIKRWKKVLLFFFIISVSGIVIFSNFFLEDLIREKLHSALDKKFGDYYSVEFESRQQIFDGKDLSITLRNITFTSDTTHPYVKKYPIVFFTGKELSIKNISAWSFLFGRKLDLKSISLSDGDLKVYKNDTILKSSSAKKKRPKVSSLAIEDLKLSHINIEYYDQLSQQEEILKINNTNLNITALQVNMKRIGQAISESIYNQIYLGSDQVKYKPKQGNLNFQLDSIRVDYSKQSLNIFNFKTIERNTALNYSRTLKYAKMLVNINIERLGIENLNFFDLISNKRLTTDKILVDNFSIDLFKNNHKSHDKSVHQKLIQDILLSLPVGLNADSVLVRNGRLQIDLLSKKRRTTSSELELDSINGMILNAKVDVESKRVMQWRLQSKIQKKGDLEFNMDLDFSDPYMNHSYWGEIKNMQLKYWNAFLFNFANLKFSSGNIKSLAFNGTADRNFTKVDIDFIYSNLKVDFETIAQKHGRVYRKRRLVSSIANALIYNNNPTKSGQFRQGHYRFKRIEYKGHFNMFVMGILGGVKDVVLDQSIINIVDKR